MRILQWFGKINPVKAGNMMASARLDGRSAVPSDWIFIAALLQSRCMCFGNVAEPREHR